MRDDVMCSLCRAGHKPTRLKRQKIHHDRRTGRIVLCEEQPFMSDGSKRTGQGPVASIGEVSGPAF